MVMDINKSKIRTENGFIRRRTYLILFACSVIGGVYACLRLFTAMHLSVPVILAGIAAAVLLLGLEMISRWRQRTDPLYRFLIWAAGLYVAWLVHFLIFLAAADLLFIIPLAMGYRSVHRIFTIAAGAAAAIVTAAACVHAFHLRIVREKVPVNKKSGELRIVHLSDLHLGAIIGRRHMHKTVQMVNRLHPDIVVITGDIFNHNLVRECADPDGAAAQLAGLHTRYGVFSVRGNHDPQLSDPAFAAFLKKAGITPLDNRSQEAGPLTLIGRTGTTTQPGRTALADLMPQNQDRMTVVLDHDPIGVREAAHCGADLVLSGHTHNGQFFPCSIFSMLAYPGSLMHGHSRQQGTHLIVSAGTGFFQVPIRTFSDSEIICIDITDR